VRRPTPLLVALVALMAVLSGACASDSNEDPLSVEGDSGFDVNGDLEGDLDGRIAPDTGLEGGDSPTSDDIVQAALTDVDDFWSRQYEDLYGEEYQTVEGGYWPYGPDSEQPPCGTPAPSYGDIAENAFYCPGDDLIAWDNVNLVPPMYEKYGGFTLGIVFAHEFGHAIQTRAGVSGDTIMTELQADCFAGAWTADVAAGNSSFFELRLDDLDKAIAGFLELRDGTGTDAADPAAHGTGFDRIGAFTEGFEDGLERCRDYPDLYDAGELVIVEVPFTDLEDFERGGNLPLDEILGLAFDDLQQFWTVVFAELGQEWDPVDLVSPIDPDTDEITCGEDTYSGDVLVNASFYCVPGDTIYLDAFNLVPALYEIGDYAVATELARQFAYAAEVRLGNLDNTLATNLQADCMAGLYAASGFTVNRGEEQVLVLSPGDLDEAVIAFLVTSDSADSEGELTVGTAFQRFDAYRSGFVEGVAACDAILAEGAEG
jgi:predicted metalloprotease